eukprot:3233965-Rhodomonas_salina.3
MLVSSNVQKKRQREEETVQELGKFEVNVVGCRYYEESKSKSLNSQHLLKLAREPDNAFDKIALEVNSREGQIGHIPRVRCGWLHSSTTVA